MVDADARKLARVEVEVVDNGFIVSSYEEEKPTDVPFALAPERQRRTVYTTVDSLIAALTAQFADFDYLGLFTTTKGNG